MMITRRLVLASALMLPATMAMAMDPAVFTKDGLAVAGYDAVAYFMDGKAVAGSAAHSSQYEGFTYQFSSAAHKAAFDADPAMYAPQYGGYCAYAVSQGATAKIDPEAWSIHDGKLYLNFNKRVRKLWESDKVNYINLADGNWPGVLN